MSDAWKEIKRGHGGGGELRRRGQKPDHVLCQVRDLPSSHPPLQAVAHLRFANKELHVQKE